MRLDKKSIIITGAAGGIGSVLTKKLLKQKAIIAALDKDKKKLDFLKKDCAGMQGKLICYHGDIGDFKFVQTVIGNFFEKYKKIDALINNASILVDAPLLSVFRGKVEKFSLDSWDSTMASNLDGVFYCSREVAEKMVLRRTRGVIVNISSVSAAGNGGQTAYAATKAGINALTVTWASELALFGIRVAGIAPGIIDTDMPKQSMDEGAISSWKQKTPLRRLGMPEEIADGVIFILNNEFICGRVIEIDGGLRM